MADLADRSPSTVYFDQSDSTGWLQAQVLPYVTAYRKAQLLRDRRAYLQPHYGNRIYADYYHRRFGVEDEQPYTWRELKDEGLLTKLGVSWNSGLADYGWLGPPRMALREKLPFNFLLRYPTDFTSPYSTRGTKISCRIGVSYTRETVAYQRRRIQTILSRHLWTEKLSRRRYLAEVRDSRVVVSPFGLGEITLRDFEVFLAGALLLKPNMDHLETWPNLFESSVTIETHAWDLSDLEETIEALLANPESAVEIAGEGQRRYRRHIAEQDSGEIFCRHFLSIIDNATTVASL